MRAALMTAVGGPDVLQMRDAARPEIREPTQMLVRLHAAGVNPVDTKLRSRGTYAPERMPAILGCDGAGVVEAVGPGVTRFAPGDEVYFCFGGIGLDPGTYAEYTVIDECCAARKPRSLSFAEAAAAPLVLITAWESLHDRGALRPGDRVLIHAGAGGVGHVAVQLARIHGARVCTTVGDENKALFVLGLGAEKVIDYKACHFVEAVAGWTRREGVDVALDTVGGAVFADTFRAVRYGGDLVSLLQPANVDWKEARTRNLRVSLELMLTPMLLGLKEALAHQAWILERCAALFDTGQLSIKLARTLPLEQASAAHRLIEAGGMTGKIALVVRE